MGLRKEDCLEQKLASRTPMWQAPVGCCHKYSWADHLLEMTVAAVPQEEVGRRCRWWLAEEEQEEERSGWALAASRRWR